MHTAEFLKNLVTQSLYGGTRAEGCITGDDLVQGQFVMVGACWMEPPREATKFAKNAKATLNFCGGGFFYFISLPWQDNKFTICPGCTFSQLWFLDFD